MKRFFRRRLKAGSTPVNENNPTPATTSSSSLSQSQNDHIPPIGIKQLYNSSDSVVDVVFVHGLTGDRERTWTVSSILWPRQLLPSKIPNIRVLTFGYEAYAIDWRKVRSQNRIANHAWNLLIALTTFRGQDNTNDRPIIFVCHSLGGLVCKDALITSMRRPEAYLKNIARSTSAILFLGTPHHGSDLAKWGQFIARCLSVTKLSNPEIAQVLTRHSEVLARIQDSFHTLLRDGTKDGLSTLDITCFYEELPYPGVGLIVPQESAVIPGYVPIGIRKTHSDMGKFQSIEDAGFVAICGVLHRILQALKTTPVIGAAGLPTVAQLQASTEEGLSAMSLNEIERSCMALFSAFDISDYMSMLPKPVQGTCRWILNHPRFMSWVTDKDAGLLWLTGHLGCGKTTLSSFVAKHLQEATTEADEALVCIYFCDDKVVRQKDARSILQSLIYQIIRRHRSLVKYVKTVFEIQGPNLGSSFSSLWGIFERIMSDPKSGSFYIIVDAIDECTEDTRRLFLASIEELLYGSDPLETPLRRVKFLLTSREALPGSYNSTPFLESRIAIDESPEEQEKDVRLLIQLKVDELSRIYGYDNEIKEYITHALYSRADHTFLWVHMVLEALQNSALQSQKDIEMIIDRLPLSLESTYERFLHSIPDTQRANAARLLNLILVSFRILKLTEVNFAFTITAEDKFEKQIWSHRQPSMDRTLRGILGPLVRISESSVSLVHQSAKEYFLQLASQPENPLSTDFGVHMGVASQHLAAACIHYLLLEDFSAELFSLYDSPLGIPTSEGGMGTGLFTKHNPFSLEDDVIRKRIRILDKEICQGISERYHFMDYAALYWAKHYSLVEHIAPPELRQAALRLLDPSEPCCTNWLRYYWVESKASDDVPENLDSILLAAYFNMPKILAELLQAGDEGSRQAKDRALFWAARMGHGRIVELLLETSADPNAPILDRQTAIMAAAQNGHVDCMKLLLADTRTDISVRGLSGRTALSLACGNGYLNAVKLLWERPEVKVDMPENSGATPFFWAVGGSHKGIISMMLNDSRINVNHQDKTLRTAISWAAGDGLEMPLKMLLRNPRVDPNLKDKNEKSPLLWAAGEGHAQTLEYLLKSQRVDKSSLDKDHRSAISWACGGGHEAALRLLLKSKCQGLDEYDIDGWNPLAWAVQNDCVGNVEALLSTGQINIEKRDPTGRTALSWAIEYGHPRVVKALIAAGADVTTTDNGGSGPMDTVAVFKRKDLVDIILRVEPADEPR